MTNIIAAVLMSLPIGFLAGWIIAKTVFRLDLERQRREADERLKRTRSKYRAWRERIRPVAVQFRQQRKIITELRDELRRRDLEQQAQAGQAQQNKARPAAKKHSSPAADQSCSNTAPTGRSSESQRASTSRLDTVS